MSNVQLRAILPQIQRLFAYGVTTGLSDGALLRRYCTGRDESAFAVLVARHGPMVLSVCRNVLRDEYDAEDAFQGVFLVLVRRAGSIRVDDSLGGWLHGVAYRVALRANAPAARRRSRERTGVEIDTALVRNGKAVDPRVAALHEEIASLPESHRQAVVLCLLEGKTQVEAAQEIGCGEATLGAAGQRPRAAPRPAQPSRRRPDHSRTPTGGLARPGQSDRTHRGRANQRPGRLGAGRHGRAPTSFESRRVYLPSDWEPRLASARSSASRVRRRKNHLRNRPPPEPWPRNRNRRPPRRPRCARTTAGWKGYGPRPRRRARRQAGRRSDRLPARVRSPNPRPEGHD